MVKRLIQRFMCKLGYHPTRELMPFDGDLYRPRYDPPFKRRLMWIECGACNKTVGGQVMSSKKGMDAVDHALSKDPNKFMEDLVRNWNQ